MGGQFRGCLTSSPAFPVHRRLGWSSLPKASGAGPPLGIPPMPHMPPRWALFTPPPLCQPGGESGLGTFHTVCSIYLFQEGSVTL